MNSDVINNPSHYTDGGIETIDFIEAKNLDFYLANVVKYVSRAGKKDPEKTLEDLEKAEWYLKRKISKLEEDINSEPTVLNEPVVTITSSDFGTIVNTADINSERIDDVEADVSVLKNLIKEIFEAVSKDNKTIEELNKSMNAKIDIVNSLIRSVHTCIDTELNLLKSQIFDALEQKKDKRKKKERK